jgi:septal ring-binding cell division protein DamX
VAAVVLVAGAAFALVLSNVGDEAGGEAATTLPANPTAAGPAARPSPPEQRAKPASPERRSGVLVWPRRDAFTVVLLSAEDAASARNFAREAAKGGVDTGVLRADDYRSLAASKGFYIVFAGIYSSRAKAESASARLGSRFGGAFPQFVDGAKG